MTKTKEEIKAWVSINQANLDDNIYPGSEYVLAQMRAALEYLRQLLKETEPKPTCKEGVQVQTAEKKFVVWAFQEAVIDGHHIDGADAQEKMEELGLIELRDVDPDTNEYGAHQLYFLKDKPLQQETEPKAVKEGELLPCPFCGEKPYVFRPKRATGDFASCNNCGVNKCTEIWNTRASIPQQEWRDIRTAPKDGTEVLLCGGNLKGEVYVDRLNHGVVKGRFDVNEWLISNTDYYDVRIEEPTHWQPLPQPPKGE